MDRMTQIKETYLHKSGECHNIEHRFTALGQKYEKPKAEAPRLDSTVDSEERERLTFFYHPDHLNSTNFVTDIDGNAVQFVSYIPYGEVFVEERNSSFSSSYLFNAKELDNETGLYYYGARYLDPQNASWLSVDPLFEKYPGISPYSYCVGNPVRLVDPDGRDWTDSEGNNIADLKSVKCFIFHDDDFKEQANVLYEDLVKQYGKQSVALSNIGTTQGFSEDWENMNGDDIKSVYIMTHGKNQSFKVGEGADTQFTSTGNGRTNISGNFAPNVQDLKHPKGNISNAVLYLFSCHSADTQPNEHGNGAHRQGALQGRTSVDKQPLAYVFASYFNFKYVQGTAESVNYHSFFTDGTPFWSDSYMKAYPANNGSWLRIYRKKVK